MSLKIRQLLSSHELSYSLRVPEPLISVVPEVWLQHAVDGVHHPVDADEVNMPQPAPVRVQLLTQQVVDVIRLPFPAQTERLDEDLLTFKRAKRPRVVRLQLAAREPRGHEVVQKRLLQSRVPGVHHPLSLRVDEERRARRHEFHKRRVRRREHRERVRRTGLTDRL